MSSNPYALGRWTTSRRALLAMGGATLGAAILRSNRASASSRYGAVIYGATPSGIMAAVAAAREGLSVALVVDGPIGGMCAQGLSFTDASNISVIGGLALSFFQAAGAAYGQASPAYIFEPHVAENIFLQMLFDADVTIIPGSVSAVTSAARKITAIKLTDGTIVNGRYFVDATYEGDFMALAGCKFTVGRESNTTYAESFAGFNAYPLLHSGTFHDSKGDLIDGVKPFPSQATGSADQAIPAYTFRLCLSNDPKNMIRFSKPAGYDPTRYILDGSFLGAGSTFSAGALPDHKFDLNGNYFGASWGWPLGTATQRAAIWQDHFNYQAGLLYFYANDPSVPAQFRSEVNQYGLAKDEFTTSNHWPTQLYVREARRLVAATVLTQGNIQNQTAQSASIGMGAYSLDAHATQLLAMPNKMVNFEGTIGPHSAAIVNPYQIPYQILIPAQFDNLLVSVCVSASHIAFSSLRVEPQYMIMGEAAGCAIGLAAVHSEPTTAVTQSITSKLDGYGAITH
jgi:hypothetical protein